MPSQPTDSFERVLVLRNPVSTHAAQGSQRIAELERIFGKKQVYVIDTVAGGRDANRALLIRHAKQLGPRTLLCIAAGDGTVGMVIETLVQDPALTQEARKTPVLPLWCGNANDLAHMLNGNAYRNRTQEVVTKGKVIAIHPLQCTLETADGKQSTRIAACYASFGATAFAAARLNAPDVRKHPYYHIPFLHFFAEFFAGLKALVTAPSFALEEGGTKKLVYERTFTNGSRFAKVERLPLKLNEEAFLQHTLEEKRLAKVVPRMWAAMQKGLAGKYKHNRTEFTVQQAILAQFDGEPTEIAAGTHICITLAAQPFYALSIVLADSTGSEQSV